MIHLLKLKKNKNIFKVKTFLFKRNLHVLEALPYPIKLGVSPLFSYKALEIHYNKYAEEDVQKLNELTLGTELGLEPIENIISLTQNNVRQAAIYNRACSFFNHQLFFSCIKPEGSAPSNDLMEYISKDFQSFNAFKQLFKWNALSLFGSGWVWLLENNGKLEIKVTPNSKTPIGTGMSPLLVLDMWEHSYFIDYQYNKEEYINKWFQAINWDFVTENLIKAKEQQKLAADEELEVDEKTGLRIIMERIIYPLE
jgi:Fe-Mn family superoxide dismutase